MRVVLDNEALSQLIDANQRRVTPGPSTPGTTGNPTWAKTLALLWSAMQVGGSAVVPAAVLAESSRSPKRRSSLDALLNSAGYGIVVVDTDTALAKNVGWFLDAASMNSSDHVDATVVAVAEKYLPEGVVVATSDRKDIPRLVAQAVSTIRVQFV